MICSICGCEMKNNGGWFACPTCGSVHFGPEPDEKPPVKKEETPVKIEKETIKEAAPVKPAETVTRAEKPAPKAEVPKAAKEVKPSPLPAPEPPKKKNDFSDFMFFIENLEEKPVKDISFTVEEPAFGNDLASAPAVSDEIEPDEQTEQAVEEKQEPEKAVDEAQEPEKAEAPKPKKAKKAKAEKPKKAKKTNDAEDESDNKDEVEDEDEVEGDGKKKSKLKDIVDFMLPIVAAVLIAFVLKTFIIANAKVPTGSMIDTINIGDRIIASRLAYKIDTPQRYDIILFYYPDDESDIFVKRVIGLPGETIEMIDGVVYATTKSGKTIQTDQSFVNPAETPFGNYGPYYIPEKGEVITVDGSFCFAENGMLMGRTDFLDKYCVKDGKDYVIAENLYFMMGDNRNQSADSRGWTFPYVAENKIIGKVMFKYYPSFEKIK